MWVWTNTMMLNLMARLGDASTTLGGQLHNAVHCLLGAPLAATRNTTKAEAEAVESDYTGYERTTGLTWTGPIVTADGNMELIGPVIDVIGGDDSASGQVYGEFLLDSDSITLLGVNNFATPIPVVGTTVGGTIVPRTGITVGIDKGNSMSAG